MIEAVKSTVANSAMLKSQAEQVSAMNSYAANPDKIQSVSQAPYVSPTVRVDVLTKIAILEFRESLSGEVLSQIPSEQAIRTYKMREARGDAQIAASLTRKPSVSETDTGAVPAIEARTTAPASPEPAAAPSTDTARAEISV